MENQTAFDLNLAIRRWREDLAHSAAFRNENLNELESHLRDSIDRLRGRELSDEEAFLVATRRIGNAQKLEQEFGKLNGAAIWLDRSLWVLVAVQLWAFISGGSSLLLSIIAPFILRMNGLLLGFGLHKIEPFWLQTALALVCSSPFMALIAALIWRFFIWPKRRGASLLHKLLHRPGLMASVLFLSCSILQLPGSWGWYTFYGLPASNNYMQIRLFLFRIPMLALWAGLTYFVARRRLRNTVA